jgi:class 3 adenylate cyclase
VVDELSATRYVAVGGADVAFRVAGDGPVDLVYFQGLGTHIELLRLVPRQIEFLKRLSSFSRLILFDRRGTGASDAVPEDAFPTCEEWTEDLRAVLEATGTTRAAIFAAVDAGPIAMLFAAMHPELVRALVLFNTSARYLIADDYSIGASVEEVDTLVEMIGSMWGTVDFVRAINPEMSGDASFLEDAASLFRFAATPRQARVQWDYILRNMDVREALPLIQAPTRVLHVTENPFIPIEHGRYLADRIDGATLVELPGRSLSTTPNADAVIEETAELVTGERPPVEIDRVLTTVLFTDIVGSTARAAALGDRQWRTLLSAHDRAVRAELRHFRGREIKTTGDGFCASFDGAARAIRCAEAIIKAAGGAGTEVRAGLHTGECDIGGDDLGGLAVHIAARVVSLARPNEVLVSSTVKDLVAGSGIEFNDRGEHQLKGVPATWKLFALKD